MDLIQESMVPAMDEVGRLFEAEEYFVPELLLAGRAMKSSMELLKPLLSAAGQKMAVRVVIGTVKGDLHDIGKNIVASMLEGGGFEVIDLGTDVAPQSFVAAVEERKPHVVCMSALLTVTMPAMKLTIDALKTAGLRTQVKVLIGGAPVTMQYAKEIGADGYSENAKWRRKPGQESPRGRSRLTPRNFYLDLAARGLRMPIGADLVLHEEPDPEKARNDGAALARVIEKTARRWTTPLAIPLMDLRLEKIDLLACAGVPASDAEKFHFTSPLDEPTLAALCERAGSDSSAPAAPLAIRPSRISPRSPISSRSAWPSAPSRWPRVSWPTPSPPRRWPVPARNLKTPAMSAFSGSASS